ncbi:hypothetical protein [Hyphomicrobium sp. 2TAF46]|uniref:hypothetical protein n=1 Tax=Hyphomicrobium sp. 2TAF46 TaxID=3233019 RepID=UPI003F8EE87E
MTGRLRGVRAKIERADECVQNLNNEIRAFVGADPRPYLIVKEFENDARDYVFKVRRARAIPDRFAVLAGEIIHHLRSSLDHLFCALVERAGKKVQRGHAFPICASKKEFRKACEKGAIKDIAASAAEIVTRVQPCNASTTPRDTILSAVREMNNVDKHHLLLVTAATAMLGDTVTIGDHSSVPMLDVHGNPPRIIGMGPPETIEVTENYKEFWRINLATPTPQFEANADISIAVAFSECGLAKHIDLTKVLPAMVAGITHTINEFRGEFDADD